MKAKAVVIGLFLFFMLFTISEAITIRLYGLKSDDGTICYCPHPAATCICMIKLPFFGAGAPL